MSIPESSRPPTLEIPSPELQFAWTRSSNRTLRGRPLGPPGSSVGDRVALSEREANAGISAAAYSFGAGLFFAGYAIFEVPSNLLLHRVGARWWLARIMVSWGIVSSLFMFVGGPVLMAVTSLFPRANTIETGEAETIRAGAPTHSTRGRTR